MTGYQLKRDYAVGLFKNPFYKFNFKAYCYSCKLEFPLQVHQKTVPNIVGICAESREARIYLFEDTQQNIIFGINDKCVFIEDIVAINWVLVESDEADSYGRKFSCQCKNPADDISIIYETGKQRWKNPLVKFNDVYSPMPDKDDIWMNDLALIVTELVEKNASRERFHKIYFSYNYLN